MATTWEQLSFLVPPNAALDWRMVVLCDVAIGAGILASLPATPAALAERVELDEQAVRVLLEALAQWQVVKAGYESTFGLGPAAPTSPDAAAVIRHHAAAIRSWAGRLPERVGRKESPPTPSVELPDFRRVEIMLEALDVNGRESAPGAVEACHKRLPNARSVLDLGGGHGQYGLEFARRGLQVTMQDTDGVVAWARNKGQLEAAGIRLFAGDFFKRFPEGLFDIVFCAGVVYTYGPAEVIEMYGRIRTAVAPGGAVAIHTFVRGDDPLASLFAVQIMSARTISVSRCTRAISTRVLRMCRIARSASSRTSAISKDWAVSCMSWVVAPWWTNSPASSAQADCKACNKAKREWPVRSMPSRTRSKSTRLKLADLAISSAASLGIIPISP